MKGRNSKTRNQRETKTPSRHEIEGWSRFCDGTAFCEPGFTIFGCGTQNIRCVKKSPNMKRTRRSMRL